MEDLKQNERKIDDESIDLVKEVNETDLYKSITWPGMKKIQITWKNFD